MAPDLFVFGILLCIYLFHEAATNDPVVLTETRRLETSLCSRKCEESSEQAAGDLPLYQCSCSESCHVYGDCCYDSPYRNITRRHRKRFICISIVGHGRYRAVSGCPSGQGADFCKDGLGHMPPVTSRETNVTYANVFCARCNGDRENLITWNVFLRCSSDDENISVNVSSSASTRYIYHSGEIWSLNEADQSEIPCKYHSHFSDKNFLDSLELRQCTHVRKTSHCSASWNDKDFNKKCRSYEDPVYFHNTAYRNIHCARCNYLNPEFAECVPFNVKVISQNGVIDSSVREFCKNRGSFDCIQSLLDMQKGRQYAFADLLNINEKGCVPPSGRRCCLGESFDFRTQRCRKVIRD